MSQVIICPGCKKKYPFSQVPLDCLCGYSLEDVSPSWVDDAPVSPDVATQGGEIGMVECPDCEVSFNPKLNANCPQCLPVVINPTVREPTHPIVHIHWPWGELETFTDRIFIGRDAPASARLAARLESQHLNVSRRHAELIWVDNQCCVRDLNSTNGTFINGQRISPQQAIPLKNGNKLRFAASLEVTVQIGED